MRRSQVEKSSPARGYFLRSTIKTDRVYEEYGVLKSVIKAIVDTNGISCEIMECTEEGNVEARAHNVVGNFANKNYTYTQNIVEI